MRGPPAGAGRPGIDLTAAHLLGLRGLVMGPEPRDRSGIPSFGGRTAPRAGQGQEVLDLRAFAEGDDVRHLDQRATARRGMPFVRRFHDERSAALILVADLRATMAFGVRRALRSYAATEALTLEGWRQIRAQGHVGLFAVTSEDTMYLRPRPRDAAMMQVIGALVRLHGTCLAEAASGMAAVPLADRLAGLDRLVRPGGRMVLASSFDAAGEDLGHLVLRCRSRGHLRLLAVSDPPRQLDGIFPVRDRAGRRSAIDALPHAPVPPGFDPARGDIHVDPGAAPRTLAREIAA